MLRRFACAHPRLILRARAPARFERTCVILALLAACHGGSDHDFAPIDAGDVSTPDGFEADAAESSAVEAGAPNQDASAPEAASDASQEEADGADSAASGDVAARGSAHEQDIDAGPVQHGSFETAQQIEVGTTWLTDELSVDQVDYYVFRGSAGSFYEISTDNTTFSPDNVLALYDATHTLLAESDDGGLWPGDGFDARLVVRLPADGLYYVRVEDLNTEASFFTQGFRLLYYHLNVREVSAQTPGYGSASGAGLTFLQDPKRGYRFVTVIDQLDSAQKAISFPGLADTALIARIHPGGTSASGSSLKDGQLVVSAADGRRLAAIDRAKDQHDFRPPVAAGDHQIALSSNTPAGANPFFVIDLVLLPENPKEQDDTQNNSAAGAEAITLSQGTLGRGLLLARLPADDVDYYRIPAKAGNEIAFSCEGESTGSGVRGLRVELRDDSERVLGTTTESAEILRYTTQRTGNYFLRLSGATPAADASAVEPWVRCVVFVS